MIMTGACVRRNGQGNSQVDKTPQFTREERQSRILRAVAIIFLIVAAANFVTFVLNWFGPVLPDGPATVVVTGLGAVESLATAGVALWSMTISQDAARAAEAREEAFRQRAELREATLRQQAENRDDKLRHEAVRPTVNLLVVWRPELYVLANGQSGGALEYSLHNHGTHGIFGILPIVAAPIEYENDAWDSAIWNEIITGPPNPSVVVPQ